MAEGTNTAGTKEEFGRKYTDYNPAPTQGPTTEILGIVLTPTPAPSPSPSPSP